MHLFMIGSPAINKDEAGTADGTGTHCLAIDPRGTSRPIDSRCDIGAFEGDGEASSLFKNAIGRDSSD
jgi:hypothetical protein